MRFCVGLYSYAFILQDLNIILDFLRGDMLMCTSTSSYNVTSSSAIAEGVGVESVWKVWEDVPNWPQWDHNFQETNLVGPFAIDSKIVLLHRKSSHPTILRICNIVQNKIFDTESELPFGKVTVKREITQIEGGVKITHTFCLEPRDEEMRKMFNEKIAPDVREAFSEAVKNISELAIKQNFT